MVPGLYVISTESPRLLRPPSLHLFSDGYLAACCSSSSIVQTFRPGHNKGPPPCKDALEEDAGLPPVVSLATTSMTMHDIKMIREGRSRIPVGQLDLRLARVEALLDRHLRAPYKYPVAPPGETDEIDASATLIQLKNAQARGCPIILDAGCGTGESSAELARIRPDHLVLGVDRSEHRLLKGRNQTTGADPINLQFQRADLVRLWLRADEIALRFDRLYLFYPNPYPKPGQLQRRWYGHSIFPALLSGATCIEIRTNWRIYAEEFAHAAQYCGCTGVVVEPFHTERPTTAFERKYAASGHALWRVSISGAIPRLENRDSSKETHGDHS